MVSAAAAEPEGAARPRRARRRRRPHLRMKMFTSPASHRAPPDIARRWPPRRLPPVPLDDELAGRPLGAGTSREARVELEPPPGGRALPLATVSQHPSLPRPQRGPSRSTIARSAGNCVGSASIIHPTMTMPPPIRWTPTYSTRWPRAAPRRSRRRQRSSGCTTTTGEMGPDSTTSPGARRARRGSAYRGCCGPPGRPPDPRRYPPVVTYKAPTRASAWHPVSSAGVARISWRGQTIGVRTALTSHRRRCRRLGRRSVIRCRSSRAASVPCPTADSSARASVNADAISSSLPAFGRC